LTIDERRRPLRGWGGDPDDPFNAQMDVASASAAIVFRDILCSDDYEDDDAVPIFIALFPDSSEFRAGIKKFKSNLNHQKSFHFVPFRRGRVAVAVATAMDEATTETTALFNAFDNANALERYSKSFNGLFPKKPTMIEFVQTVEAESRAQAEELRQVRTNKRREVERDEATNPKIDRAYYIFKENMIVA
jgi:hypothetical protein